MNWENPKTELDNLTIAKKLWLDIYLNDLECREDSKYYKYIKDRPTSYSLYTYYESEHSNHLLGSDMSISDYKNWLHAENQAEREKYAKVIYTLLLKKEMEVKRELEKT